MRGFLEPVEQNFFAWLKKLTFARMSMTPDDLYVSAAWGACEALRAGVTCVADASDSAETSLRALSDVGLGGIVFQESFGPDTRLAEESFAKLTKKIAGHRALETSLVKVGVSPHAPYTVSAPLLELISKFAIDENLPLMMHAAETRMEVSLIDNGEGMFAEGLRARGIDWIPAGTTPIQYLHDHGVLKTQPLLAHCIHVNDSDIDLLHETATSVAHCPKSNAKLGHGVAPLNRFIKRQVKVGLGSDSVASNNVCDLFEEARFAVLTSRANRTAEDFLSAEAALQILTVGGAESLKLQGETGELKAGRRADFIVVGLSGTHQKPSYDPVNTLIFSSSGHDVVLTVVGGKEVYRDGKITTIDEQRLRERVHEVAKKLA